MNTHIHLFPSDTSVLSFTHLDSTDEAELEFLVSKTELRLYKAMRIGSNDFFNHEVLAMRPLCESFVSQSFLVL